MYRQLDNAKSQLKLQLELTDSTEVWNYFVIWKQRSRICILFLLQKMAFCVEISFFYYFLFKGVSRMDFELCPLPVLSQTIEKTQFAKNVSNDLFLMMICPWNNWPFRPRKKKNLFYGRDQPLFSHLLIFFFTKKIVKLLKNFGQKFQWKIASEASKRKSLF